MASSYDVINLSALAVPDAIVVPDAADIFTRWLARLRELDMGVLEKRHIDSLSEEE